MYRKTSSFIFILILLINSNLFSQKIFREGFVLKNNDEILNGLLEYAVNQDAPSTCNFKRFDIAMKIIYSPEQIKAFGYRNGNRYETKSLYGKVSFYEVIVSGKINLYRKGSKYFVEKDLQGLIELKEGKILYANKNENKEFSSLTEFLKFITENKAGNISEKFNLNNEIVPLITAYNKDSGASYFVYNRQINENSLNEAAMKSGILRNKFWIVAGIDNYGLKLTPTASYYVPNPGMKMSWIAGVSYERLLSRKTDRMAIRFDLLYFTQNLYSYSEYNNSTGDVSRNDAYIGFSGIKVPVLFQYSFTGNRFTPFVNGGVAYQSIFNEKYLHINEIEDINHVVHTYQDHELEFQPLELSLVCGAGVKTRFINTKSISVQGRFEYGSGLLFEYAEVSRYSSKKIFNQNSLQATFLIGIAF